MRLRHVTRLSVAILSVILLLGASTPVAVRQGGSAGNASTVASWARTLEERWLLDDGLVEVLASEVIVLLVCSVWCGLLAAGMEAFDLWRERREEKAAWLHARIASALQRDGLLGRLAVTPIVHVPVCGWSRPTIEVRGQVPTLWLHYAVLRAIERAIATNAAVCHILDRITIVPSMEALAV